MNIHENSMVKQVFSIPELLREQYGNLEPKTRKILTTPEIFSIQRIILTGCGDSFAAAMATRYAFQMLTDIPTEVVSALELSRLYHPNQLGFSPLNPLVIALSNSGNVARVAEAAGHAAKHGALVLGITGNGDSALAKCSSKVMQLEIPEFESAPGTRSYLVSVLSLLLLAVRFGEVRGSYTMDEAMDIRRDMLAQADALEKHLPETNQTVREIAKQWQQLEAFDFIGGGFDYAAAWFGHAKIMEAIGKYSMHINSEEWLHLNFFLRSSERIGTVLVANTTNPCHSRNREVLQYMRKLKRPSIVLTDGSAPDFGLQAEYIHTPVTKYPINMPLTQFAPLCLLAGYLCEMNGEEYGRGCKGLWSFAKDGAAVKNSIVIN